MKRALVAVVSVVAILGFAPNLQAAQPVVEILDLGTPGQPGGGAQGINNQGEVAGTVWTSSNSSNPFYWSEATGVINLGTGSPPVAEGYSWEINEAGQVMGWHLIGQFSGRILLRTFVWSAAGGPVQIDPVTPVRSVEGMGINASGQVAGYLLLTASYNDYLFHPFVWQNGVLTDLFPLLPAGTYSASADAINDAGQVVGYVEPCYFCDAEGYRWSPAGGVTMLESLPDARGSYPTNINEAGQASGITYLPSSIPWEMPMRATMWQADGTAVDLGVLGGNTSAAMDINNRGEVTGYSTVSNPDGYYQQHAFYWSAADGMIDLGTLGGDYSCADSINDLGQVVGYSETANDNEYHAFFWSKDTGIVDLGVLGATYLGYSRAWKINEQSEAVGFSSTDDGENHPVLWRIQIPSSPCSDFDGLVARIQELVDAGVLSEGLGNSLTAKVENAHALFEAGKKAACANLLGAFIREVKALGRARILNLEQQEYLIAPARVIINCLGLTATSHNRKIRRR